MQNSRSSTSSAMRSAVTILVATPVFLLVTLIGPQIYPSSWSPWAADPAHAQSEGVKAGMGSLLAPLRQLQPYLADQSRFEDPSKQKEILSLLQSLRAGFHTIETVPSRYHTLPGFDFSLQQVTEILTDSTTRLSEGKAGYAWWRSRVLPGACFSCHATYQVTSSYSNEKVIDSSLDDLNQARFLLATRQFTEAQTALLKVLADPTQRFDFEEALTSLLTVETRTANNPQQAVKTLQKVLNSSALPEDDADRVRGWILSLELWAKEKPASPPASFLLDGERLVSSGLAKRLDGRDDLVLLLRGTALLHKALESDSQKPDGRRHALYLLGAAYNRLPMFFAQSWSEMYLEQCISEFPGTPDAKNAFRVMKESITEEFTGSAGTSMPAEVRLRIEELRKKAFGVPTMTGRV